MYTILQMILEAIFRKFLLMRKGPNRLSGFPPVAVESKTPTTGNAKVHYCVKNLTNGESIEGKGYIHDMLEILITAYGANAFQSDQLDKDPTYDHACELMEDTMRETADNNMLEHVLRIKTVSDVVQSFKNNLAYNKRFPRIGDVMLLTQTKFHENLDLALDGEKKYPSKEAFTDYIESTMFRMEYQVLISAVCKCYVYMIDYIAEVMAITTTLTSALISILCCIPVTWKLAVFLLQSNPYTLAGEVVLFVWVFSIVLGLAMTINSVGQIASHRKYSKDRMARRSCIDFSDSVGTKYRVFFTLF